MHCNNNDKINCVVFRVGVGGNAAGSALLRGHSTMRLILAWVHPLGKCYMGSIIWFFLRSTQRCAAKEFSAKHSETSYMGIEVDYRDHSRSMKHREPTKLRPTTLSVPLEP